MSSLLTSWREVVQSSFRLLVIATDEVRCGVMLEYYCWLPTLWRCTKSQIQPQKMQTSFNSQWYLIC